MKSLYIVYYYNAEQEKDFECIVSEKHNSFLAQTSWQKRFKEEYDQEVKDEDVVGVYEIETEGNYKIVVERITT